MGGFVVKQHTRFVQSFALSSSRGDYVARFRGNRERSERSRTRFERSSHRCPLHVVLGFRYTQSISLRWGIFHDSGAVFCAGSLAVLRCKVRGCNYEQTFMCALCLVLRAGRPCPPVVTPSLVQ